MGVSIWGTRQKCGMWSIRFLLNSHGPDVSPKPRAFPEAVYCRQLQEMHIPFYKRYPQPKDTVICVLLYATNHHRARGTSL